MDHLDTCLSIDTRVSALLGRMTLAEKAHQLTRVMAFDLIRPDGSDLESTEVKLARLPGTSHN